MIVITGPGRSGTSFVASLYKELGFDPGGPWRQRDNAGFEHSEFVDANEALMRLLGTSVALGRRARRGRWGRRGKRVDERLTAGRRSLPALYGPLSKAVDWSRYGGLALDVVDWSKLDAVVAEHGERLRVLAGSTAVVKDPRFCWTLPAWLTAGAAVEAVVLVLRDLDAVVDSRGRAFGHDVGEQARSWARNDFAYGVGLALCSAVEHRVPVEIIRFPDLLEDPRDLHARLPLPEPRDWDSFDRTFESLRDRSLVHDDR